MASVTKQATYWVGLIIVVVIAIALYYFVFADPANSITRSPYKGSQHILSDGRRLSLQQYGDTDGVPIFYFHDAPGSRLEVPANTHEIADESSASIIAVERPGYGYSDKAKNYSYTQFAKDIEHLADHLQIAKFSIIGFASGGPYALAVASRMPKRVNSVVLVSSQGPLYLTSLPEGAVSKANRLYSSFLEVAPLRWILNLIYLVARSHVFSSDQHSAEKAIEDLVDPFLNPAEKDALMTTAGKDRLLSAFREAMWQGTSHIIGDLARERTPWGFDFTAIPVDVNIEIYHGTLDPVVPLEMAKFLALKIPSAAVHFQEAGHFSILYDNWRRIISKLTAINL